MTYIEPRNVTIQVDRFIMDGVIEGSFDSFKYESLNEHFRYWFPSGEIDSLEINEEKLKQEQKQIVDACKAKIDELLTHG